MVVLTTDAPRMELERTATVSLDRLVLLMRVLGPHQMCLVQQTTVCGLQHRWQRENQGAQGVYGLYWRAETSLTSPSYVGEACCSREGYEAVRRCSQWSSR